jgi:serine/threonine protein phosphatase PrpC
MRHLHLGLADRRRRHHYDSNTPQTQRQEVIDLRRLVRLQNRVIMGLSLCFLMLVICTLVLVQHIPHPNNERGPFWERTKSRFGPDRHHHQQHQLHNSQQSQQLQQNHNQQRKKKIYMSMLVSNCSHFGCPLLPLEISRLMSGNATVSYYYPSIASNTHMMITHKGKPAPVNQDRAVLIPSYVGSVDVRSKNSLLVDGINDLGDDFFVGVFDGHGNKGHEVAKYASEEIPSRISSKMVLNKYDDDKERSLTKDMVVETFREVDADVPITDGGTTATVMLRVGNRLYIANTGDSTSFVVIYEPPDDYDERLAKINKDYMAKPRGSTDDNTGEELLKLHLHGKVTVHHKNVGHKPHLPHERSRIESRGGRVYILPRNPNDFREGTNATDSRVIIAHEIAGHGRGDDVGLSTSRSIGDRGLTVVGVIPDPDVVVIDLKKFWSVHGIDTNGSKKKVFVVLGSDGLFDNRKAEFVSSHLAYGFFEYNKDNDISQKEGDADDQEQHQVFSSHLLEVGKKIVTMASPLMEEWYRDDITFIAKIVELQS